MRKNDYELNLVVLSEVGELECKLADNFTAEFTDETDENSVIWRVVPNSFHIALQKVRNNWRRDVLKEWQFTWDKADMARLYDAMYEIAEGEEWWWRKE